MDKSTRRLVFRSNGEFYGIFLRQLIEVLGEDSLLNGVIEYQFKGNSFQIPLCWLGSSSPISLRMKALLIRKQDRVLALMADEVLGIIDSEDIQEHPALIDVQSAKEPWGSRLVEIKAFDVVALELDMQSLFSRFHEYTVFVEDLDEATEDAGFIQTTLDQDSYGLKVAENGTEFSLPIQNVIQVIPFKEPENLPGFEESVVGLTSFQGDVVPLVDLGAKTNGYGNQDQTSESPSRIIILTYRKHKLALVVDRVSEIINLRTCQFEEADEKFSEISEYQFKSHNQRFHHLDIQRLLCFKEKNAT